MNTIAKLATLAALAAASGCINDYDYDGDYEMAYNVVMSGGAQSPLKALAGLSSVAIHEDVHANYFVDLGASFCRLAATDGEGYDPFTEFPWLQINPQPCWYSHAGSILALSVSGSATYHDDTDRVSIDLAGTYSDDKSGERGTLTLRLDERW